ncbi:hypothetical protein KKG36_01965 [Patescibacteria group bacterium]|nr:hypothetical protein [Patescibacteria group bacterium]
MINKIKKSSGEIAKTLLILAVLVLVALVVAYFVVNNTKPAPPPDDAVIIDGLPDYEATLGDVRFVFLEAEDVGDTLYISELKDTMYAYFQEDLKSTERFVKLIVGAQNVGKENTGLGIWGIGEIVDSEGRSYTASGEEVNPWLPDRTLCGSILKPSFEPTPCEKYFEVAKVAQGLKVKVILYDNSGYNKPVAQEQLIDIRLMP